MINLHNHITGKNKTISRADYFANYATQATEGWHVAREISPPQSDRLDGIHDPTPVTPEYAESTGMFDSDGWGSSY